MHLDSPEISLYRVVNSVTQQVEILDDPVDPFRIVDIPFAIRRVHLPPPSMHTNDYDTRVSRKISGGESLLTLLVQVRIRFSKASSLLYVSKLAQRIMCAEDSLVRK